MAKEIDIKKILKDQTEKLIEVFDDKMKIVEDGFKIIYQKLNSHEEQTANLTVDMMEVKSDIKQIKFDIKMNLDNKIDKKHFVELDTRVRRLEKK